MAKPTIWLVAALVLLSMLASAGPTLIGLANAATPLVIAAGSVAIAWRLVGHFTRRY